ncbi:MAG: hypothetical protein MJZ06_09805 [Bacteroidaceae bacterium]|nr:hypothetical protein [Bacteroidaceae bacterium]
MKKTYTNPRTRTVKVQQSAIICASPDNMKINDELGSEYEDNAYAW